jgi:hypothetical protein
MSTTTEPSSFSRLLSAANELLANMIDKGLHKPDLGIDGDDEDFPVGDDGDRWYADAWELHQADEAARKDKALYDAAPKMLAALREIRDALSGARRQMGCCSEQCNGTCHFCANIRRASAAIAEAHGP